MSSPSSTPALLVVPAGTVLFDDGKPCRGLPQIERGRVKVFKTFANGRELLLYHIEPGDSCVVSLSCLFTGEHYNARAVAETEVALRILPLLAVSSRLAEPAFRDALIAQFAHRISELMALVDAVVTHRLDQRLATLLLQHGTACPLTHQQLADRLGTVREIVSRLMRRFQDEGWVAGERGLVRILDPEALRRFGDLGH
ncbi:MAG: Crp/Fnr family transcriptional regulator [Pseudomonadota bacterium]|nr:Crp/Fnr family transcriptional regulator [Pseudomonadota bacterium]